MALIQQEPKKIYIRVEAQPITTSGIYHNSDLGLISLSSDGSTWLTIADKNLGTTQVRNDGDTLSEANCGKYYQWGNNYGFPRTGTVTTSSTLVNASTYGPGNYYNSSTFILSSDTPFDRANPQNDNLRGGVTGTNEARQGPCDSGFHIPSTTEYQNIISIGTSLGIGTTLCSKLKMPLSGNRIFNTGLVGGQGDEGYYFCNNVYTNATYIGYFYIYNGGSDYYVNNAARGFGYSIRPFKNEAVQPDDSRTKLY